MIFICIFFLELPACCQSEQNCAKHRRQNLGKWMWHQKSAFEPWLFLKCYLLSVSIDHCSSSDRSTYKACAYNAAFDVKCLIVDIWKKKKQARKFDVFWHSNHFLLVVWFFGSKTMKCKCLRVISTFRVLLIEKKAWLVGSRLILSAESSSRMHTLKVS